jgi:hypothetical protein
MRLDLKRLKNGHFRIIGNTSGQVFIDNLTAAVVKATEAGCSEAQIEFRIGEGGAPVALMFFGEWE